MEDKLHIVALLGSLRQNSFNKAVLNKAIEVCPPEADIEKVEIGNLPIFNADLEENLPPVVIEFKAKIKSADAILIVTPEYNFSIPGGLKNAIDWGSRPFINNSFEGKPVSIMSAAPGNMGGSRGQYHLRQCFIFLNMFPINRPEVIVSNVQDKVVENVLTDQHTIDKIIEQLTALINWTKKLKS
jgi:chromate reductase